jgi:hypothetical protein
MRFKLIAEILMVQTPYHRKQITTLIPRLAGAPL